MNYLLDTNICIYLFKAKFDIIEKMRTVGFSQCGISEITLAELIYGAEKSNNILKNKRIVESFADKIDIIPIFDALEIYGKEKARLKTKGTAISDFDLLIGATAIKYNLVLVTQNIKEFERMENIKIENWAI
jgi:tRNA(fMet)-specific endonuclease VapC